MASGESRVSRRYDKENLLWQSTVAIKSDPVGSVLHAGLPPIVVPSEARLDYIRELWGYQRAVGVISRASRELLPEPSRLDNLHRLVGDWWQTTLDLVAEAKGSAK